MLISQKIKNDKQDTLIEELLREKAAVLTRAGVAVENVLVRLMHIEHEIEEKMSLLNSLHDEKQSLSEAKQKLICEEINMNIDQFNVFRQKAQLQYYYLIVTREALGLRRHEMVQNIYRIPDKKPRLQAD